MERWRVGEYTKKMPYQWESLQGINFGVSLAAENLTKFTNQFRPVWGSNNDGSLVDLHQSTVNIRLFRFCFTLFGGTWFQLRRVLWDHLHRSQQISGYYIGLIRYHLKLCTVGKRILGIFHYPKWKKHLVLGILNSLRFAFGLWNMKDIWKLQYFTDSTWILWVLWSAMRNPIHPSRGMKSDEPVAVATAPQSHWHRTFYRINCLHHRIFCSLAVGSSQGIWIIPNGHLCIHQLNTILFVLFSIEDCWYQSRPFLNNSTVPGFLISWNNQPPYVCSTIKFTCMYAQKPENKSFQ